MEEASTHKSAKTGTGTVFVSRDLDRIFNRIRQVASLHKNGRPC